MVSNFYLGHNFDFAADQLTKDKVIYDPANLSTQVVVTGMTGSGKTIFVSVWWKKRHGNRFGFDQRSQRRSSQLAAAFPRFSARWFLILAWCGDDK
jgi:hypothetical protein